MRFSAFFAIFALILAVYSLPAQASPKPWVWSWWPSHWDNQDFKPYLEDPKEPHNSQWDNDLWEPSDWYDDHASPKTTMDKLYGAGIITDQYVDDDVPVLEVGHNFMRLSGQEKRRVAAFVDHVFGITQARENGMFYVYYEVTDKPIGVYTKDGLQLQ